MRPLGPSCQTVLTWNQIEKGACLFSKHNHWREQYIRPCRLDYWLAALYPFLPSSVLTKSQFLSLDFFFPYKVLRRLTPSPGPRVSLSCLKVIPSSFPEVGKLSFDPLRPWTGFLELLLKLCPIF